MLVFFLFLLSLQAIAREELDLLLEAIKEDETTTKLLESEGFSNCSTQAESLPADQRRDSIRNCMATVIQGFSEEQLQQLADRLDLKTFDPKAVKTSRSLREYLGERLREGLYGREEVAEGRLQKFRDKKQVNHDIFFQLYKEQIGKNTLLTASQYCLENFGGSDPKNLIYVDQGNIYSFPAIEDAGDGTFRLSGSTTGKDIKEVFADFKNSTPSPALSNNVNAFWTSGRHSNIKEYKVCNSTRDADCSEATSGADGLGVRTTKQIEALKKAQLELGAGNEDSVRVNYEFCLKFTIKKMCGIYKCKAVYDNTIELTDEQNNFCTEELGIELLRPTPPANGQPIDTVNVRLENAFKKGQIACNVMERLSEFRKITSATQELTDKLESESSGINAARTKLEIGNIQRYQNRGESSVDRLTSISSGELASEVDSIAGSAEEAERLRELCFNEQGQFQKDASSECEELLAEVDTDEIKSIEMETEGKTALFSEQLQGLTTDEELTEFLNRNGMSEYVDRIDELDGEELRNFLELEFRAKNQATLEAIRERFNKQLSLAQADESNENLLNRLEADIADQTVSNIAEHKARVESLFQYSNIVSSYLEGSEQDADGNAIEGTRRTVSVTGRLLETDSENLERTSDEEVRAVLEQYSGGSDDSELPDSREVGYENIFKMVLDFGSDNDQATNQGNSN